MTMDTQPKKKRRSSMCVGCGGQITDQYILRVSPDLEWHATCLKCAECHQYLDESQTCFVRDGKTYCKRDYIRLFGTKCAKCSSGFSKNDFVMRARNRIYHIDCFRCVACSRQLIPGDEFALREDGLFCKADHEVVERSANSAIKPGSPMDENVNNAFNNNNNEKQLVMKQENDELSSPPGNDSSNSSDSTRSGKSKKGSGRRDGERKTTRVRTVMNEKQLHMLRTCYRANPRPDALMKEQLVEMTNLSPRVIRVWFQNKRCKDKKRSMFLKQMQQQQENANVDYKVNIDLPVLPTPPHQLSNLTNCIGVQCNW